jgi:hypothetical protein
MPLDQRATSYADKLLLKSRREIDAKLQAAIEGVVNSGHRPGSLLPGVLLKGLVDVYVTRIRELGVARMNALLTAYEDAGIPLDEKILGEIKADVLALCHSNNIRPLVPQTRSLRPLLAESPRKAQTKSP